MKNIAYRFLLTICSFLLASNLIAQNYSVQKTFLNGGASISKTIISGHQKSPLGTVQSAPVPDKMNKTAATSILISDVPAFNWCFGPTPTSAAMIAGYYDRHGYDSIYTGPTNSGVMPLDNSSWPVDTINGEVMAQCPLSATRNGLDGRTTRGHVDDYWVAYGSSASDPFATNGWTQHTYGDCTADYMKSNQSAIGNADGSTTIYNYTNGQPLNAADMETYGIAGTDGGYGLKLFYESRGYTVANMFNQYVYGYNSNTLGFTFEQYKNEINAGRPVIIHLAGHTVVGFGYDNSSNLVYIHDTWDYLTHSMTWGGSYSGMQQYSVTVVRLAESEIDMLGSTYSIPDGDATPSITDGTDFDTVRIGNSVSHTFTIRNTGSYKLQLTNSPGIQINGSGDFTVTSQPSDTSLAPGDSTTFTVQYNPSGTGLQTASISIVNSDLNENPYNFSIQGTGLAALTLVEETTTMIPADFSLQQNYPNPFNPSTSISFALPERSQVTLKIFDLLGREAATLMNNEVVAAGKHTRQWNASNMPSGVYFYKLQTGTFTATKKLVLMK